MLKAMEKYMNQSYARINAPFAMLTLAEGSECNCTKIIHTQYFLHILSF